MKRGEKTKFYKYQGTGNDFVIVDQMENEFDLSVMEIEQICHRRFGIGADGLMYLRQHDSQDFTMIYFNADGNEGSMCGNGGRCISHLYFTLYGSGKDLVEFDAIDGYHQVKKINDNLISLKMKEVDKIHEDGKAFTVDTGSPHYVVEVAEVAEVSVKSKGAAIRNNETYIKEGINVNFLELADNHIKVRTYERGVEDETFSCGTGVTACAIISNIISDGELSSPIKVSSQGGVLEVSFEKEKGVYKNVWLTGPAVMVFEGVIDL